MTNIRNKKLRLSVVQYDIRGKISTRSFDSKEVKKISVVKGIKSRFFQLVSIHLRNVPISISNRKEISMKKKESKFNLKPAVSGKHDAFTFTICFSLVPKKKKTVLIFG